MRLEPPDDPGKYSFVHRVRVRFAETDAMGVVHHSAYFPYLEEARVAYLRSIGHPYESVRDGGHDFAVLEAYARYVRPLRFDEVVDVHLMLGAPTRATFQIAYLLCVDGEPRASAVTVHGCVDHEGRPARMPRWVAEMSRIATS